MVQAREPIIFRSEMTQETQETDTLLVGVQEILMFYMCVEEFLKWSPNIWQTNKLSLLDTPIRIGVCRQLFRSVCHPDWAVVKWIYDINKQCSMNTWTYKCTTTDECSNYIMWPTSSQFANTVVVPGKPRFGGCVCKQYSRQILNEFEMCGVNEA